MTFAFKTLSCDMIQEKDSMVPCGVSFKVATADLPVGRLSGKSWGAFAALDGGESWMSNHVSMLVQIICEIENVESNHLPRGVMPTLQSLGAPES